MATVISSGTSLAQEYQSLEPPNNYLIDQTKYLMDHLIIMRVSITPWTPHILYLNLNTASPPPVFLSNSMKLNP